MAFSKLNGVLRRVLVCAPSNAAIDEILKRLTADPNTGGGIFDGTGKRFSPTVMHRFGQQRLVAKGDKRKFYAQIESY